MADRLPTYGQLAYQGLWPGVDMVFRGAGREAQVRVRVAPGASPSAFGLAYAGADGALGDPQRKPLIQTPLGTLRDSTPRGWQQIGGKRVPGRKPLFARQGAGGANAYGFALGSSYDRSHPLVIDPGHRLLDLPGRHGHRPGQRRSRSTARAAPTSPAAPTRRLPHHRGRVRHDAQRRRRRLRDEAERRRLGARLLDLPGRDAAADAGLGIAVDGAGSAYVTGYTSSTDFPTTAGAFDTTLQRRLTTRS